MYTILNRDFMYKDISAVYFTNTKIYDNRGYFHVGFNKQAINSEVNKTFEVIQHNISNSISNVARGLHFQVENNQAKIVHCLDGSVIDIIVDMRINSPFFGQGKAYILDNINTYLFVPRGFAHGFIVNSDEDKLTTFEYFVDDIWNRNSEYVLNMQDYLDKHNIFVVNNQNEIKTLSIDFDDLLFSAKDFNIAKTYLADEESINDFKNLVKNNKDFNY